MYEWQECFNVVECCSNLGAQYRVYRAVRHFGVTSPFSGVIMGIAGVVLAGGHTVPLQFSCDGAAVDA